MTDRTADQDTSLDALIEENAKFARDQLLETGSLTPMYALKIGQTTLPIAAQLDDNDAKDRIVQLVRTLATAFWPQSIAFMMESWFSDKFDANGDPRYPRPSLDPDRREGVFIVIATPEQEVGRMYFITRDQAGNVADLVEGQHPTGQTGGRMSGLYPEQPPTRQQQRQAQRQLESFLDKEMLEHFRQHARRPASSARH